MSSTVLQVCCIIATYLQVQGLAQSIPSPTSSSNAPSNTVVAPAPTHPPIPPANTPALPPDFSDIPASVISCWDAQASYTSASWFLYTQLLSSENYTWNDWSTTSYSYSTYLNERFDCKTTALPSLTTLCDGFPRASTSSTKCQTVTQTYTFTITGEATYYTPPWSTELDKLPSPTCTVASDYGALCTRLKDAYKWRTSFLSQNPSITGSIAGPGCTVLNDGTVPSQPPCYLEGGTWEAFYWPTTAIPSGPAFCDTNSTNATTTSGQARTAVVSGITMTSPSVYYLLRNAILQTLTGRASLIGNTNTATKTDIFAPSTTASLLTVAQREADIVTISRVCAGSGQRRYCTFHGSPGFSIADLATVRASEYCGYWGCGASETIYQDEYTPTLGIPVSEVAAQNGVFGDCAWTTPGLRVRTAGTAAYNGGTMKVENWHPITATSRGPSNSMETGA
ncbi:hypothetical protein GGP41_000355 [Bipolaris sorokiniana]|uniref:Uncharacterized protein n=2 Tax=Cochliobolus sativus TaxID=45130 RepID=A0A8H5ZGW9_COCSA|nr:uncharacterized protein COCSADRAFT_32842 [Bipolaris sorokiniana ND90Pr]EMD70219.1 hypothetical protein COCSADRAFT_32842 [Bipolaris sorokiniana ND90Pr]KAF5847633.1 hypothetical protein GGP41_000355 [Bipolaris sorokiniana]